jgi:hypothetical protein
MFRFASSKPIPVIFDPLRVDERGSVCNQALGARGVSGARSGSGCLGRLGLQQAQGDRAADLGGTGSVQCDDLGAELGNEVTAGSDVF